VQVAHSSVADADGFQPLGDALHVRFDVDREAVMRMMLALGAVRGFGGWLPRLAPLTAALPPVAAAVRAVRSGWRRVLTGWPGLQPAPQVSPALAWVCPVLDEEQRAAVTAVVAASAAPTPPPVYARSPRPALLSGTLTRQAAGTSSSGRPARARR
jgi:hypothetical protein